MDKKKKQPHQAAEIKLRQEFEEMENRYKRVLADYQNLEKRQEQQTSSLVKYAAESILDKLIPVLENLERAQDHLKDKGLEMVVKQFHDTLDSEGLEQIKTDGEDFDPETMDCVELVEGEKDKVINTLSRGWRLYDKILRPAKVSVGKN